MRVSRFRGRFVSAVYVGPVCNTPSVRGEQDFRLSNVTGHRQSVLSFVRGTGWTRQQKGSHCGKSLIFHNVIPLNEGASNALSRDLRVLFVSLHPGVSGGRSHPAPFKRVARDAWCDDGGAGFVVGPLQAGVGSTPPAARSGPATRSPAPNAGGAGCRILQ